MLAKLLKLLGLTRKVDDLGESMDTLRGTIDEVNGQIRAEFGLPTKPKALTGRGQKGDDK